MASPAAEAPLEYESRSETSPLGSAPGSGEPPAGGTPPLEPGPKHRRPRNLAIGVLAIAVVVAVVAVILANSSSHRANHPAPSVQGPAPTLAPDALPDQATEAAFGVYPGDGTAAQEVTAFKALSKKLGRTIPYVVLMGDARSQDAFRGSVFGHFIADDGWKNIGPDKPTAVISVPLAFGSFTPSDSLAKDNLGKAASGVYDGSYKYLANALMDAGYPNAVIRLGWEFDAPWMPWTAQADPKAYVSAFRHVHDVFAQVSSQFRFDWTSAAGYEQASSGGSYSWLGAMDWSKAYPGDDYVDIIGVDLYDQSQHQPYNAATGTWTNPQAVWTYESTPLTLQRDFAVSHNKQVSFPEWGLTASGVGDETDHGGDNPTFVEGMAGWFDSLPAKGAGSLAYQAYFQGTMQPEGIHAIEHFPKSFAKFSQLFTS